MLRYSRQLLCPFVGEVISLASLGRIVEKCSVNASGISDGVGNRSVLPGVLRGKFIDCLPGSSRVIFVFIKWLFVIKFFCDPDHCSSCYELLYLAQPRGFLDRIAFSLTISRSCIRFFNSDLIYVDFFRVNPLCWTIFKSLFFHISFWKYYDESARSWLKFLKFL